ncbi:hypothetical protein TUM4644_18630 [Shewanella colwelliana]|uniref:DUF924 domain-containing protein n=1 Tax=Shewanella colwelliana TaxID=23 RepID=A0A1E5IQR3_SHECO|nr:DUF924 family protein [Shewanella colwelliana]MDX1280534.1 DUF924 family protein [Shewanella colwelliana]OEG72876.1 hypothetical protein BEL05_11465 [Shewanella colwelliana]GIU24296.1 hypothetical protein TUM4644_18630 [Shewanella colwelliana]GIU40815.1 hypothetical protein TUM3794_19650 [Shewanella colwelliana]
MEQFLQQWFYHYEKGDGVDITALKPDTLTSWQQLLSQAKQGQLESWKKTPPGRLGLILLMGPIAHLLDDDTALTLQTTARELCVSGVERGFDTQLEPIQRRCFYDPLFYSNKADDKALLLRLLQGMQSQLESDSKPAWSAWYKQAAITLQ